MQITLALSTTYLVSFMFGSLWLMSIPKNHYCISTNLLVSAEKPNTSFIPTFAKEGAILATLCYLRKANLHNIVYKQLAINSCLYNHCYYKWQEAERLGQFLLLQVHYFSHKEQWTVNIEFLLSILLLEHDESFVKTQLQHQQNDTVPSMPSVAKDLGLYFIPSLHPGEHIGRICAKTNVADNTTLQSFGTDHSYIKSCFTSVPIGSCMQHTVLEYGTSIWSPHA